MNPQDIWLLFHHPAISVTHEHEQTDRYIVIFKHDYIISPISCICFKRHVNHNFCFFCDQNGYRQPPLSMPVRKHTSISKTSAIFSLVILPVGYLSLPLHHRLTIRPHSTHQNDQQFSCSNLTQRVSVTNWTIEPPDRDQNHKRTPDQQKKGANLPLSTRRPETTFIVRGLVDCTIHARNPNLYNN